MSKLFTPKAFTLLKKAGILALMAFMVQHVSAQQQQILLFSDTFNAANTSDVIFDYAPGPGTNSGNNDWTVNANYIGQPVYPNTPSEDSVVGGLGNITYAPYSSYLHIHDVTNPGGVSNANWNHTSASDRFVVLNNDMCTSGLTNVSFAFFWTGNGDSTAYGRVYYSTDGATWHQTGKPKYYNQSDWAYEVIQDTNFNNQQNLIFGFRWVNAGSDTTTDVSWGIDDIIAVGAYNTDSASADFQIISVQPDTNCESSSITVTFSLNPPLCYGNYEAYMSNGNGSFSTTTPLEYPFSLDNSSVYWQTQLNLPANDTGECFRIYFKRVGPPPIMQSDTSACFAIIQCPVSIITNDAPVVTDVDTACLKSAIDIYFNSFGNFSNGNIYYAQLSDSTGSFAHPTTIGQLPSSQAYPAMPGDVSGLIPASVPPGCGYYIRIISTAPASIGTVIGPFCLRDCDATTNNTQDIQICLNYPYLTDTTTFTLATNQWNQGDSYDTCNNWTIELLDMMTFNVVNIGGLGIYHADTGGIFTLIVGPLDSLPPGVQPGTYYMRIIDNCSNQPWNEQATVIRITIGAPSNAPPVYIISTQGDSIYCNTSSMELFAEPYNPASNYFWSSNEFNPIEAPGVLVNLEGASIGNFVAYVREENYGCYGPNSAPYNYVVTAVPRITISGPHKVCPGDTAIFDATFYPGTYYTWTASEGATQVVLSNSQVSYVFDSVGTYVINGNSLNDCGSDNGNDTITVTQLFDVNAKPNKTVCYGDSVTLTGNVAPYPKEFISLDSSTFGNQGGMFNIYTHNNIIIDSFAVSFRTRTNNTTTSIYSRQGSYRGYEQSPGSWTGLALNTTIAHPSPVLTKTVIPVELNMNISAGDTVAFYITTTNSPVVDEAYGPGLGIQQGVVYKSDGVIDFIQGTENAYPFGASAGPKVLDVTIYYRTLAGLHYLWSNGDTTSSISLVPTTSGQYNVSVYDTLGCHSADTVQVTVDTLPHVYAGPDTIICPNANYVMPATASANTTLSWAPVTGLSQATVLNPTLNTNQPTNFILTATGADGCPKSDSVLIAVYPLSVYAGPDTLVCAEQPYVLQGASASTDSFMWIPATGLSATNILNPTFTSNQSATYVLIVTDSAGCTLADTVNISVEYCNAYIKVPQAFTPNGDGINDFFTVFGKYISDYKIRIYNRWGEEVYSSDDVNELNDLSRGWDGTYKGKLQDVGTFVYYIEAKDMDGNNIFKKGNVTLIR